MKPLSEHCMAELRNLLAGPLPVSCINPGVRAKLDREGLAEYCSAPSPFKTHKGQDIQHLRITDAGRKRLA